jgi:carbamoyl-phosphate synthase large subunit
VSLSLLFLCGGRRVELLRQFRRALDEHGGGRILTTDTEPHAATSFVADRSVTVAPCRDTERFAADVAEVCEREGITAVVPLRCDAVLALPALRTRTSALLVTGDDEAIGTCCDKLLTAAHFQRAGLPTPKVVMDPTANNLPLFCRPRCAEGSKGAAAILTQRQLERAPRDGHVFTRHIDGAEYTLDCYKNLRGELIAVVPRQRLRVRAGEVERSVTRRVTSLIEAAQAALDPLHFIGPATLQAFVSEHGNHFTEINLRYGGGVTLSIAAGADSPRWLVAELCGRRTAGPVDVRWNFGMSRYDAEFYYQEGER